MKLLWQELKKHKKVLFGALALATINQVFSLIDPQIFRFIIDNYASKVKELEVSQFLRGVSLLLLASVGAALISRTAKAFQNYYVSVVIQRSGTNLYSRSVSHSFSLPYSVFEDQRSGELLNKLQKARTDSQALILNAVNILFLSLVSIVFVLTYATTVYWLIGLIYFLIFPVLGTVIYTLSKKIKLAQQMIVRETASLSGSTTETIRNVELVKSMGLEAQEVDRLNAVNEKILSLELKKVKMVRKLDFVQGTLTNAIRSALLLFMLWMIFREVISIGQFFTLWIYSFFVFEPLNALGLIATSYQEANASLNQLEDVLKQKPEPVPTNGQKLGKLETVEYKDVSLRYGEVDKSAVDDVSLKIDSGETVAFVGPSGSGKSSMVKLLAGLYLPTKGKIFLNSVDLQDADIVSVRQRMGLVAQETQLFAGTIRENLLFVKPDATDKEMMTALEEAQAVEILNKNTKGGEGLETRIGEGGLKLSGGERQRLAIARALLRNPDVIVFDEATSSLDSITEKSITDTIRNINSSNKDIITIIVAHRLSTVMHADRIYVFERGKVVEHGTHEALIKEGGLYAALWREQVGEKK